MMGHVFGYSPLIAHQMHLFGGDSCAADRNCPSTEYAYYYYVQTKSSEQPQQEVK